MEIKKKFTIQNMVIMAMFLALLYIGAIVQIPLPMDDYFTLQFLVVLLCGYILGWKLGTLTVFLYVFLGLMGIPWFASGGGFGYLVRGSFGFLIGFIFTAFIVGFLSERIEKLNFWKCLLISFLGMFVCYLFGFAYKYILFNWILKGDNVTSLWAIILASLSLDIPCDSVLVIVSAKLGPVLRKEYLNTYGNRRIEDESDSK